MSPERRRPRIREIPVVDGKLRLRSGEATVNNGVSVEEFINQTVAGAEEAHVVVIKDYDLSSRTAIADPPLVFFTDGRILGTRYLPQDDFLTAEFARINPEDRTFGTLVVEDATYIAWEVKPDPKMDDIERRIRETGLNVPHLSYYNLKTTVSAEKARSLVEKIDQLPNAEGEFSDWTNL